MRLDEKLVYGSILALGVFFVLCVFYVYIKEVIERKKERLAYKELMWTKFVKSNRNEKFLKFGKIISYKEAKKKGYVPRSIIEDNSGLRKTATGEQKVIPSYVYVDSFGGFGGGDCGGGGGDCGGGGGGE